jgi:3-oxoacyl-[acyl-carrier protein] reductase
VNTDMRLDGRLAVVTGAAQGLGEGIARLLAAAGARLAVVDVKQDGLERVAAGLREAGGEAQAFPADLGDAEAATALIPAVRAAMGPVDILVNNAGLVPPRQIEEITLEEWDRVLDVNLRSVFVLSRAVIPDFRERGSGRIVNMSSGAGKSGALAAHYAASKAAILVLTRTFATALGKHGVTVNAICPGPVPNEDRGRWPQSEIDMLTRITPLGRLGTPLDVANLVLFLASDLSSWITGQSININGGMRMD